MHLGTDSSKKVYDIDGLSGEKSGGFLRPIEAITRRHTPRCWTVAAVCISDRGCLRRYAPRGFDPVRRRWFLFSGTIDSEDLRDFWMFDADREMWTALPTDGEPEPRAFAASAWHPESRALDGLKRGEIRVLVATDIAARGIDVEAITHVIQMDLPEVPEQYVHRIGRTARAGVGGVAWTLCGQDERALLREIERKIRKEIDIATDHPYPPATAGTQEDVRSPPSRDRNRPARRGEKRGAQRSEGERTSHASPATSSVPRPRSGVPSFKPRRAR